jgi:hypothetical protein
MGISLLGYYLATIWDTQTEPQAHKSNNFSIVAYIRRHGNVLTGLLSSNERRIHFTEALPSKDMKDTHTDVETNGRDL